MFQGWIGNFKSTCYGLSDNVGKVGESITRILLASAFVILGYGKVTSIPTAIPSPPLFPIPKKKKRLLVTWAVR